MVRDRLTVISNQYRLSDRQGMSSRRARGPCLRGRLHELARPAGKGFDPARLIVCALVLAACANAVQGSDAGSDAIDAAAIDSSHSCEELGGVLCGTACIRDTDRNPDRCGATCTT